MGCPGLWGTFVVRTDPKNSDYVFEGDLRRKVEEYSSDEEQGHRALGELDHRDQAKELSRRRDPMQSLERKQDDRERARERAAALQRVRDRSDRADDDYGANACYDGATDPKERRRPSTRRRRAGWAWRSSLYLHLPKTPPRPGRSTFALFRGSRRACRCTRSTIFGGDSRVRTAATLRRDRQPPSLRLRPRTGTRAREPALVGRVVVPGTRVLS